jgi:hypothetical protein
MKTAVEFLKEIIQEQRENGDTDLRTILYYCREAKEMEREQIIKAHTNGWNKGIQNELITSQEYYNETYESKTNI